MDKTLNEKLRIKDIITIVLMSLVNIIIFGFGTFFYLSPFTVLLMPVFYSLFQGIVFFMLGAKVKKRGAMLIYCIIQGAVAFNIPYILMYTTAGAAAELILARKGYGDMKALTASYIIMQMLAAAGSTIYPYGIVLDSTLKGIEGSGDLDVNIAAAGQMIQSWGMIVLILLVLVSAAAGAVIGRKVTVKHFRKNR